MNAHAVNAFIIAVIIFGVVIGIYFQKKLKEKGQL